MDFVFWIIVIVLIVGVVWWLLNRSGSATNSGSGGKDQARSSAPGEAIRAEGALAGGSAAASADAAATAGIPSAAGFGRPAEPVPPTTADDEPGVSAATTDMETTGLETADAETTELETGEAAQPARADVGAPDGAPAAAPISRPGEEDLATPEAPRLEEDSSRQEEAAEWETQWSEAGGSPAAPPAEKQQVDGNTGTTDRSPAQPSPVHHDEYTGPHTPTLPGAETAAGENAAEEGAGQDPVVTQPAAAQTEVPADATPLPEIPDNAPETETADRTRSSEAVETAGTHMEEPAGAAADYGTGAGPAGHLAADEPYGQGSASPAPDGSGPADYTVKGDAGSMVYYEEGHPDYEQTRAEVWFESAAHAEAAGFRAPRRNRS